MSQTRCGFNPISNRESPSRSTVNRMRKAGAAMFFVGIGIATTVLAQPTEPEPRAEYPSAMVREEQHLIVNGQNETWQLKWASKPKPNCGVDDVESSSTCPCQGFGYGEGGDLFLVRIRDGVEIDSLHLTPFFTGTIDKAAVLQRWPFSNKDFEDSGRPGFVSRVKNRAVVQVMRIADYDHDGQSQEFYLQTEALPCGKSTGIVVGLSQTNPRLHVFGTVMHPSKPLILQKREWQALRDASGPVDVVDWRCADHGADTETRVRLRWSDKGISGVRGEYTCAEDHKAPRHLIRQESL
jgi:hypothetical protein